MSALKIGGAPQKLGNGLVPTDRLENRLKIAQLARGQRMSLAIIGSYTGMVLWVRESLGRVLACVPTYSTKLG